MGGGRALRKPEIVGECIGVEHAVANGSLANLDDEGHEFGRLGSVVSIGGLANLR
jgi:hypothetical protein